MASGHAPPSGRGRGIHPGIEPEGGSVARAGGGGRGCVGGGEEEGDVVGGGVRDAAGVLPEDQRELQVEALQGGRSDRRPSALALPSWRTTAREWFAAGCRPDEGRA